MPVLQSSEERQQLAALKAHQKAVREHKSSKKRVDAIAEALSDAQEDHILTAQERESAKTAPSARTSSISARSAKLTYSGVEYRAKRSPGV